MVIIIDQMMQDYGKLFTYVSRNRWRSRVKSLHRNLKN
jgi:hypothetical protein